MKHAAIYAKRLASLLRTLRRGAAALDIRPRPPLLRLIHSFLCYDATHRQADAAINRLVGGMIDLNDLRVSDPVELAAIVGEDYPGVIERCFRLKHALNSVYLRQHAMDLDPILKMSKTDARAYLDALEGMLPYVSAEVMLLCMDAHAIPVDEHLRARLVADGVVDPEASIPDIQAFLENHIPHSQALQVHGLLRAYVERAVRVNLGPLKLPASRPAPASAPAGSGESSKRKSKTQTRSSTKAARKPAPRPGNARTARHARSAKPSRR